MKSCDSTGSWCVLRTLSHLPVGIHIRQIAIHEWMDLALHSLLPTTAGESYIVTLVNFLGFVCGALNQ